MTIGYIRANSLRSDPRVIKMAQVAEKDHTCRFIVWNRDPRAEIDSRQRSFNVAAPFGRPILLLYFPFWWLFCFWQLVRLRPDVVHTFAFEEGLPGYIYARLFRKKFIYDLWDTVIGRFPTSNGVLAAGMLKLDQFLAYRADLVLVYDDERIEQLQLNRKRLGKRYQVIMTTDLAPKTTKRLRFKNQQPITISYTGVLSRTIRGLEHILAVAPHLPGYRFIIAGYGPDGDYFAQRFRTGPSNIVFTGRLGYHEARAQNRAADIMITLLDPNYPNYRYAKSSKVADAFTFSKPVITTSQTATGTLIEATGWGIAIPYSSRDLEQALKKISSSDIAFVLDRDKVKPLCWEVMGAKLRRLYRALDH